MPRDENAMVKLEQTDLSNFLQALDLNRDDDKVKVETTEPSKVGKWFRTTFKWCVDALSLGCLRRPKYSVQTDAVSHYPMRGSPHAQDDDSTIYAQAPTQGPHLDDASMDTSNAESTGQNIETAIILHSDNVADAWNHEVSILDQQRQFTQTREPQPTIPPASENTTFCGYGDAAQTNMLYGFMDELNTRSVPRMNAEPKPAIIPAPVLDTPKKQGPWSSDEHDRYCAGLERCRYGSWKLITDHVGTRTERQVMSHAQSIRAKRKRADERKERHQAGCASSQTRSFEETVASKTAMTTSSTASSNPKSINHSNSQKFTPEEGPAEYPKEADSEQSLTTLDWSKPYEGLDFDVCSPPLDILVESVFSDEELLDLLDITS